MLAASRTVAQCGPREDTEVAFCEVGESLFAAFLLAACTDGLRFANV